MATNGGRYPVCLLAISSDTSPDSCSTRTTPNANNSATLQDRNRHGSYTTGKFGHLQDFSSQIGASGIVVDHQKGLVITTLLPFTDFLDPKHSREISGQFGHQSVEAEDESRITEVLRNLSVSVILPAPKNDAQNSKLNHRKFSEGQLNFGSNTQRDSDACVRQASDGNQNAQIQQASGLSSSPLNPAAGGWEDGVHERRMDPGCDDHLVVCEAKVSLVWRCQALEDELLRMLPKSDGWTVDYADKFDDIGRSSQHQQGGRQSRYQLDVEEGEDDGRRSETGQANFISWFCLLQVEGGLPTTSSSRLSISSDIHTCQPVIACGTPFATLSPSVFLNSLSSGIITKTGSGSSSKGALVMTDARCMPGMEGGGLFVEERGLSCLAAIIISPLCWKSNEWVGLTLACSVSVLVESLKHNDSIIRIDSHCPSYALHDIIKGQRSMNSGDREVNVIEGDSHWRKDSSSNKLQRCLRSVVLIRIGNVWGSGVIVNAQQGLILTCRHVVKNATTKQISVKVPTQSWTRAEIVYVTSDLSPLDLAVLRISEPHINASNISEVTMSSSSCQEGSKVYAVGYPLFEPRKTTTLSVTSGIVSKVVTLDGRPVMIQSSCAVHAGASGGALLCATTGQLVGIIASNSKDVESGASFPHVNFSIPVDCFRGQLDRYVRTGDASCFKHLETKDQRLASIWALKERGKYRFMQRSKL